MTAVGDRKETTVQIQRLVPTKDRNDQPQWEVQCRWPWTPDGNRGGDKTYVWQNQVPEWDQDTTGAWNVLVEAAYLKRNRDHQEYDGSKDWMFFWRILELLDHPPAPAAPAQQQAAPSGGNLDQRIAWNSAINNAVQLVIADTKGEEFSEPFLGSRILHAAEMVYSLIIHGPPQVQNAPDAPESHGDEPEPQESWSLPAAAPEGRDVAPGQAVCSIPEHHQAPLLPVMGSKKPGHPIINSRGEKELCYGSAEI